MLKRYEHNPILQARSDLPWCSIKVYNCAISYNGNEYQMLFRGVGNDWISRIGYAESTNGIDFHLLPSPVLSPSYPWESHGCEDPRIVSIDNTYWITYTAFDGQTTRAALTSSLDLIHFGERKLLFPQWNQSAREGFPLDWSKAAAIFPQKINNQYYMFFGDSHIWLATSSNLTDWTPATEPVLSSRPGQFDGVYVEMGPPPILTDHGWLIIYHGIDQLGAQMTYRLGAALLERNNPAKVIWRSQKPILEPLEKHERVGFIDVIEGGFETLKKLTIEDLHQLSEQEKLPRAVFCCGAVSKENGQSIQIYYGAGDTVICVATIDLESIYRS